MTDNIIIRARAATGMATEPQEDVLRKRVEQLEAALKPFVWAEEDFALLGLMPDEMQVRTVTTMGDVRRAAKTLKGDGE